MSDHAVLSASAAARWIACPGSIAMSAGKVDTSSEAADWGTAAHELAAWCLTGEKNAEAFRGRKIAAGTRYFTVNDEMIELVQTYVDIVRQYVANTGGQLLVEQRVDYSAVIGVPDSFGTGDAIILTQDELIIIDLKSGRGEIVDAFENYQLRMYGLGALEEFGLVSDFTSLRKVIVQPRVSSKPSEHVESVDDLIAFARLAAKQGKIAMLCLDGAEDPRDHLEPTEKGCRWCRAKSTCPKLRDEMVNLVRGREPSEPVSDDEFEDLTVAKVTEEIPTDYLQVAYSKIDLFEGWLKAIRAEALSRCERGEFPGYKMVQGKQGNRAWSNEEEAEALLKASRLKQDEMYKFTVISPTQAEKVLESKPRIWKKVEALITRGEGKPIMVPESDKRTALATAADFEDVSGSIDDLI